MADGDPMSAVHRMKAETDKAKQMTPEQIREQEKNLIRGVFDAWPEVIGGLCEIVNELYKQQIVLHRALDDTEFKVKGVSVQGLKARTDEIGMEAFIQILGTIDANNRRLLSEAQALRADRDALRAKLVVAEGRLS